MLPNFEPGKEHFLFVGTILYSSAFDEQYNVHVENCTFAFLEMKQEVPRSLSVR